VDFHNHGFVTVVLKIGMHYAVVIAIENNVLNYFILKNKVPLQSIELPVGDDYQPNGDKFIKVGDHLESSTPSPPSMQEQIDIRRKLSEVRHFLP